MLLHCWWFQLSNYIVLTMSNKSTTEAQMQTYPPRKEQATSSSKKKYEWVWRIFFLVVMGVATVLLKKVYIFQTSSYFEKIRMGSLPEILLYGVPFSFLFTFADWLIHFYCDDLCMKYYITEERYLEASSRKKRCFTLVKWGYSLVYYAISSAWAYKIMIDTAFMPTWLGGIGDPYSMSELAPQIPDPTLEMKIFYICQFGKHFSRFFGHIFIRSEGNFFQYCLHHGLSIFLILFSYLTNQWHIGIFVLLIHDYSDFSLIIARAYKDYKKVSKLLLNIIYVNALSTWIFCRIFLFISVCIIPACYTLGEVMRRFSEYELQILLFPYGFMIFMMCGLEVLHLFWTYYIVESSISVNISTKIARHTYD